MLVASFNPVSPFFAGLAKDGCKQEAVEIVYSSVKAASQAVAALHKQNVGGGGAIWARQLGGEVMLFLCYQTCLDFRNRCVYFVIVFTLF